MAASQNSPSGPLFPRRQKHSGGHTLSRDCFMNGAQAPELWEAQLRYNRKDQAGRTGRKEEP